MSPTAAADHPDPRRDRPLRRKSDRDDARCDSSPTTRWSRAEPGISLLEVAEREGLTIEAGCRMGVCGADPVAVLAGTDCLTAPRRKNSTRCAGSGFAAIHPDGVLRAARVRFGSGQPDTRSRGARRRTNARAVRPSITSVVVLGNGIAGVTAADFVRRGHPDCEVHLVGAESHVLYNRMGISRLVYGRSAMSGLYLLAEEWYEEHSMSPPG